MDGTPSGRKDSKKDPERRKSSREGRKSSFGTRKHKKSDVQKPQKGSIDSATVPKTPVGASKSSSTEDHQKEGAKRSVDRKVTPTLTALELSKLKRKEHDNKQSSPKSNRSSKGAERKMSDLSESFVTETIHEDRSEIKLPSTPHKEKTLHEPHKPTFLDSVLVAPPSTVTLTESEYARETCPNPPPDHQPKLTANRPPKASSSQLTGGHEKDEISICPSDSLVLVRIPPSASPIEVSDEVSRSEVKSPVDLVPTEDLTPVGPPPPPPLFHKKFSSTSSQTLEDGPFDLSEFTLKLAACVNQKHPNPNIAPNDIFTIIAMALESFKDQPIFLELQPPMKVCGDVHGQFPDLLRIFKHCGFPPRVNYLFLGDYVDRGKYSIETILLLFCYKILYPHNFFLLRGNHEAEEINRVYGFFDECNRKYEILGPAIYRQFQDVFNWMPVSAIIDQKILCMHGGLSPEINLTLNDWDSIKKIKRPTNVPGDGIICDLLWSDPRSHSGFKPNDMRKISYTFGEDVVDEICDKKEIDLICRGHEVVEEGYEFFAEKKLVTLFSAPNYCGQFNNKGVVMTISPELLCSFFCLTPRVKRIKK